MPVYEWRGEDGTIVEVERKIADHNVPPDVKQLWTKLLPSNISVRNDKIGSASYLDGQRKLTDIKERHGLTKLQKEQESKGNLKEAKLIKKEASKVGKI